MKSREQLFTRSIQVHQNGPIRSNQFKNTELSIGQSIGQLLRLRIPWVSWVVLCQRPNTQLFCSTFLLGLLAQKAGGGTNIFVQITKCKCPPFMKYICPNFQIYLSKFPNVFVQISKCICSNFKNNFV